MRTSYISLSLLAAFHFLLSGPLTSFAHEGSGVTAEEALRRLERGNARFVAGRLSETTPAGIAKIRRNVALVQKPYAIVVGCSDSRVGPEVVFDQKVGDIFVVRSAGEVVDSVGLGSIEYAVSHLGVPLIVVLGHERCGAVTAAVAGSKEAGHINAVLKAISNSLAR